jgi:hypothetical protein
MLLVYRTICTIFELTGQRALRGGERGRHESRRTTAIGPGAQATPRAREFFHLDGGSLAASSRGARRTTGRSRETSSALRSSGSPHCEDGENLCRAGLSLEATVSHEIRRNALKWLDWDSDLDALVLVGLVRSGDRSVTQIRTQRLDKSQFGLDAGAVRREARQPLDHRLLASGAAHSRPVNTSTTGQSRGTSSALRSAGSLHCDDGEEFCRAGLSLEATVSHEIRRNALKWLDWDSDLGARILVGLVRSGDRSVTQIRTQRVDKSQFGLGRRRSSSGCPPAAGSAVARHILDPQIQSIRV